MESNEIKIFTKLKVLVFGLLLVGLVACGQTSDGPPNLKDPLAGTWFNCREGSSERFIFGSDETVLLTDGVDSFSGAWTSAGNEAVARIFTIGGTLTVTFAVSANKETLTWVHSSVSGKVNPPMPYKKSKSAC